MSGESVWNSGTAGRPPHHTDLSPLVFPANKVDLRKMWESTRDAGIEGLMIKLRESPYIAGRPQGKW